MRVKILIRLMRKKDRGDIIGEIAPVIIALIAMAIAVVIFSGFMVNITRKNDLDQVCRSYILKMETTGYLDTTTEAELRSDLASLGLGNIDLAGTTTIPVDYGNTIVLSVAGDMPVKKMSITEFLGYVEAEDSIHIKIRKISTAKN